MGGAELLTFFHFLGNSPQGEYNRDVRFFALLTLQTLIMQSNHRMFSNSTTDAAKDLNGRMVLQLVPAVFGSPQLRTTQMISGVRRCTALVAALQTPD